MRKPLHFKTLLLAALLLLAGAAVSAPVNQASKTISKTTSVPADVTIRFTNLSADIRFNTTDENVVTIKTDIKVTAHSAEDVQKIIDAVENFEFELNGDQLEINTRFYKNMLTRLNVSTITLSNGKTVKYKELEVSHEVNIPRSANLNLVNKYSDIGLEDLDGEAHFDIYSSKLTAGDIAGEFTLESKYSRIRVENLGADARFDVYDSDIDFVTAKNLKIVSKYSKFEGQKAGALDVDSYDDKFRINEFTDLRIKAKYSDLVSEAELNNFDFDLYDCSVTIKSGKKGSFSGKYSDLRLGNVKELKVNESYDNDLFLGKAMKVNIAESKYSQYEMEEAAGFTLADGYDDNVMIDALNSDFAGLTMNGKYGKLEVDAGNVPYQLDFKIKYPKIDIPETLKTVKHIEKNSELELVANDSGGKIKVEGYHMKVVIK